MTRRSIVLSLSASIMAFAASALWAAADSRAPLTRPEEIGWVHAPFEVGDCSLCHERADAADPGGLSAPVNELCFGCHDQIAEMMSSLPELHGAAEDECTVCHNAHNARGNKLLIQEVPELCIECHDDVGEDATKSPVQHDTVIEGRACLNCHNPHASNVEALLTQLPFDQCVDCHGSAGLLDDAGREMTDFRALLAANPVLHGPVESKDCSACHHPHGSKSFRLLTHEYPARFYASYEEQNYALCFECHESERFVQERTTTLTGFRDGDKNLHYVHVNKSRRGRTCRACHDVHAAPQAHLIRDGVPYGSRGWVLEINFVPGANGGSCSRTCHPALSYDRTGAVNP